MEFNHIFCTRISDNTYICVTNRNSALHPTMGCFFRPRFPIAGNVFEGVPRVLHIRARQGDLAIGLCQVNINNIRSVRKFLGSRLDGNEILDA